MHVVTTPVYSADNIAILAILGAVALLWRHGESGVSPRNLRRPARRRVETLGGQFAFLRRRAALISLATVAGIAGGSAWQYHLGTASVSTVSLLLPAAPAYPGALGPPFSLDTEAQLAWTPAVTAALTKAAPRAVQQGGSHLQVTATPNTRILHLSFSASDPAAANRAVTAAGATLLDQRAHDLKVRQQVAQETLRRRASSLTAALQTVDRASKTLTVRVSRQQQQTLLRERYRLLAQIEQASAQSARVESLPLASGRFLTPTAPRTVRDGWYVWPASGLMTGLVVGLSTAWLAERLLVRWSLRGLRVGGRGRRRHRRPRTWRLAE
jgi:hypothetical protein